MVTLVFVLMQPLLWFQGEWRLVLVALVPEIPLEDPSRLGEYRLPRALAASFQDFQLPFIGPVLPGQCNPFFRIYMYINSVSCTIFRW
ncbi:hypothetical protein F5X96DRAFT_618716 [Biscogniauxia mediterranea]|nr:hypothetical protein F5X96DRAFT_618716 [Biscogniauxia mediterranea]